MVKDFSTQDYIEAFIGRPIENVFQPLVFQFWFLRNLIVLVIVSPLMKFLVKKLPCFYFVFITFFMFFSSLLGMQDHFGAITSIFYFSLGFYLASSIKYIMLFIDSLKWKDFIAGWAFLVIFITYFGLNEKTKGNGILSFFVFSQNIYTMLLFLKIAGKLVQNKKIFDTLKSLSSYSFFIYAAHAPFVTSVMRKLLIKIMPKTPLCILLQFFLIVFVSIVILVLFASFLEKCFPRFFCFITGNRRKQE